MSVLVTMIPARVRLGARAVQGDTSPGQPPGEGYRYAHDEAGGFAAGEQYLPEGLARTRFYAPVPRGLELRIGERLAELRALNAQAVPADPGAADP